MAKMCKEGEICTEASSRLCEYCYDTVKDHNKLVHFLSIFYIQRTEIVIWDIKVYRASWEWGWSTASINRLPKVFAYLTLSEQPAQTKSFVGCDWTGFCPQPQSGTAPLAQARAIAWLTAPEDNAKTYAVSRLAAVKKKKDKKTVVGQSQIYCSLQSNSQGRKEGIMVGQW